MKIIKLTREGFPVMEHHKCAVIDISDRTKFYK